MQTLTVVVLILGLSIVPGFGAPTANTCCWPKEMEAKYRQYQFDQGMTTRVTGQFYMEAKPDKVKTFSDIMVTGDDYSVPMKVYMRKNKLIYAFPEEQACVVEASPFDLSGGCFDDKKYYDQKEPRTLGHGDETFTINIFEKKFPESMKGRFEETAVTPKSCVPVRQVQQGLGEDGSMSFVQEFTDVKLELEDDDILDLPSYCKILMDSEVAGKHIETARKVAFALHAHL